MTPREQLRAQIQTNAARRSLRIQDLKVVPDPYAGWRIYAVSPDFEGMSGRERREAVLAGIDQGQVQWCELLTPVEAEWSGGPPREVEPEDVPMWPEALARGAAPRPVRFASDLDEDLDLPLVVTFYSLRGGVGRSTALAYTARILAQRRHSVLCVDMDLEAPGLAAIMGCEEAVARDKGQDKGRDKGVVELLLQLEQGDDVDEDDVIDHVVRLSESDELYLLPAGRPDADYARKLRLLDPESWYREQRNPLHRLIDLAGQLPFRPQAILIDARTGLTTLSAPLRDLVAEIVHGGWDVSRWSADQTLRVWNVLAGERMRGGKTAFTYNWVWNRMADGNGDHGPRALLQLCREAVHWERRENERTPYDRSVIRPRALIESLGAVSDQAVEALREEFKELDELIERLQRLGRSPVEATDLADLSEEVPLAREVGLLEVYEETEQEVQRYRVPDLYRIGLRVTRRGPS